MDLREYLTDHIWQGRCPTWIQDVIGIGFVVLIIFAIAFAWGRDRGYLDGYEQGRRDYQAFLNSRYFPDDQGLDDFLGFREFIEAQKESGNYPL